MFKLLKRMALVIGVALLVLIVIVAVNTLRYVPDEVAGVEQQTLEVDVAKASRELSDAIRFQTVSTDTSHPDFEKFLTFLQQTYPAVHATMKRTLIGGKTPLYEWKGSDTSKKPVLLAAHYDVVSAPEDTLDRWDKPPFSGDVSDGFVWGRGTLDNKGALIAILTAAEQLINDGFKPTRTIYFSFGHDEEVGGRGAFAVAMHLRREEVRMHWALDEGSFVLEKVIPGLDKPVASINLAEKGYLTLDLVAKGAGGLDGLSEEFFDTLGRHFSLGQRIVFANRWLFEPLLESILSNSPPTNAMLRTTTAPTMLSGSAKENVLATEAIATVNFRLHPRDTVDGVVDYVTQTIDDDQIEVRISGNHSSPASPVSSTDAEGYKEIETTIQSVFGPLATVPGLTIAATDARHYALASDQTYRINPFKITNDDLKRFRGINERLSLENLEKGIRFYALLMQRQ